MGQNSMQICGDNGSILDANQHNTGITDRLTAIVAQRGETTLCTYEVGSENNRSAPIATVEVEERGITLLAHGFLPGQTFVDYYNEPFDSELFDRAFEIITEWNLKETYDWAQFTDLASGLNQIGDDYESETRRNCRFHFAYYYEEGLPQSVSEEFLRMVYTNPERIPQEEYSSLINNGL